MVRRFDAQRPDRPPRADRRRPSCVPGRPGRRVGLTRMCSSAPPRLLERGSRSRSRGRSPMGDSNLSPISGSRQRRPRAILDVSSASMVVCLYSQNRSLLRSWGKHVSVTSGASVGEGACLERDPQRALPVPGTDGKRGTNLLRARLLIRQVGPGVASVCPAGGSRTPGSQPRAPRLALQGRDK